MSGGGRVVGEEWTQPILSPPSCIRSSDRAGGIGSLCLEGMKRHIVQRWRVWLPARNSAPKERREAGQEEAGQGGPER